MSSYSDDDGLVRINIKKRNNIYADERESDQMRSFMLTLFSTVKNRESGREVENQRWQIESLVINVPRHLQVEVAFPFTRRPTVARDTIVHSATSHLAEMEV